MKKKIKISLILSLAIIFGCFSNVFAATNQSNKINKIAEVKKSVRLLDNTNDNGVDQYTKLLMHMDDNSFKDELGHTVTNHGVTVDTTNKELGSGSAYFDGKSYLQSSSNSDWNFKTDNFTIDLRVKFNNSTSLAGIFSIATPTEDNKKGIQLLIKDNKLTVETFSDNTNITLRGNTILNDDIWYNLMIVRDNTSLSLFVDGKIDSTVTNFTNSIDGSSNNLYVGASRGCYYLFNGNIDEFRISKGIARVPINSIELNKTTDTLTVGQTDTLIATVTPDNVTNKTVKWVSSDPTIVSVDANGKITALKAGTATITATTTDGTNLSKSCVVTVTEQVTPTPTVGNRATLTINMVNGSSKQYDLSEDELNSFLNWYNGMTNPLSSQCYTFNNPIIGPYLNNKDYIPFNKIDDFKVQEYTK